MPRPAASRFAKSEVGRRTESQTGFRSSVAGYRAGQLRRRVRGKEEPLVLHGSGDGQVGDPGLHTDIPVGDINLQHPVQPCGAQNDRVRGWQRPAGQGRSRAARNDFDAKAVTGLHRCHDFIRRTRQKHGKRRAAVCRQGITLIGQGLRPVGDHGAGCNGL